MLELHVIPNIEMKNISCFLKVFEKVNGLNKHIAANSIVSLYKSNLYLALKEKKNDQYVGNLVRNGSYSFQVVALWGKGKK